MGEARLVQPSGQSAGKTRASPLARRGRGSAFPSGSVKVFRSLHSSLPLNDPRMEKAALLWPSSREAAAATGRVGCLWPVAPLRAWQGLYLLKPSGPCSRGSCPLLYWTLLDHFG